jgi:hypothetical protein
MINMHTLIQVLFYNIFVESMFHIGFIFFMFIDLKLYAL